MMKLNVKGKFAVKKKKPLLAVTALVLVVVLTAGIWLGTRGGGDPVNVYPFQYLGMTEYWGDSQESYGPVTTDKIQTVYLSDTQTVTEILVKEGDTVKKGDKLMSFDTTLDGLALERKRLETEKIKLKIKDVDTELGELKTKTPIEQMPGYGIPAETTEPDLGAELIQAYQLSRNSDFDGSSEEKALICWLQDTSDIDNTLLDALWQRAQEFQSKNSGKQSSSASAVPTVETTEPTVETTTATEPSAVTEPSEATEPSEVTQPSEATELSEVTQPNEVTEPSETAESTETTAPTETIQPSEITEPAESTEPVQTTEPAQPTEPEVTVSDYYVIFKVTEDNMALGSRLTWQGMHVYKMKSGGYSFQFFDAFGVEDHTVVQEEEEEEELDFEYAINYTAQELAQLISELNKDRKELEFDLKMAEAEYKIMQMELSDGNIYADVDGEVVSVLTEDEARSARQPVIKVSGGGGFYVEGSVSELEKDNLKPGQTVTINDWNSGQTYEGEVKSIGDFPTGDDGWMGAGNPNASYYPFQVFIDGSADLQSGRYVSVTYSTAEAENGIYLENPFIRTENGRPYVYVMGENGKLEKRAVTVGKSLWGSYTQILSGVSEDDLIAFPYGKNVKDGAPAVESDISALYTY